MFLRMLLHVNFYAGFQFVKIFKLVAVLINFVYLLEYVFNILNG